MSEIVIGSLNRVFSLSFTFAMYKLSKSYENVSFPSSSNAYGAKIVCLSLCKETQTISPAGKKLLAIFNTGQTRTNHWNLPSIPWWLTCIKTSKSKSLRRFKYTVHPLFKALYRYTRLKYKTKVGKTGFLDRIEKNKLVFVFHQNCLKTYPHTDATQRKTQLWP